MSFAGFVLITGCSDGGIGSALAKIFHQRNFKVFATARDISHLSELKDLPNVTMLILDVVKSTDIAHAVEKIEQETDGKLDFLINNAGNSHFMPILDVDINDAKELFDVNVWGALAVSQAFSRLLIRAKGNFIFITSVTGYMNIPWMGIYAASKRSIEIIAETLRLEMKPFNVNVLSIVTAAVTSNGQSHFDEWSLPETSHYKHIEAIIANRARGGDGNPRMPTMEYATAVVDQITHRATERFWYGMNVDRIKSNFACTIPHEALDAGFMRGTGLDSWPTSSGE